MRVLALIARSVPFENGRADCLSERASFGYNPSIPQSSAAKLQGKLRFWYMLKRFTDTQLKKKTVLHSYVLAVASLTL